MIVCVCRGISERHVETIVAAGATTVDQVTRSCGAASDWGLSPLGGRAGRGRARRSLFRRDARMKGLDEVVTLLNEVLTAELTAINQAGEGNYLAQQIKESDA